MLVSIVIPTHNRRLLLACTLDSLSRVDVPAGVEVELIVVANNCTDGTEVLVADLARGIRLPTRAVIEGEPGLNCARNRAVAEARGDWIAFLDDDVWVSPGWLSGLIAVVRDRQPDFVGGHVELWWEGAVGDVERPAWLTPDMEWMLSNNELGPDVQPLGPVGGLVGANFACRRAVFDVVGRFRPDLDRIGSRLLGGGESELIQRALRAGFRGFYAPGMSVKHRVVPHRVTVDYLTEVSYGYAYARVLMKPTWERWTAARALAGHIYLAAWHGLLGMLARLTNRPTAMRHRCLAAAGRGGLAGTWCRCRRT